MEVEGIYFICKQRNLLETEGGVLSSMVTGENDNIMIQRKIMPRYVYLMLPVCPVNRRDKLEYLKSVEELVI